MRTKLPIGIDGFEKIRTNDFYYVDKTLFIRELLQDWGEVNLFTRPRCFGKSLNMSMLKCFFEAGGDPSLFDGLKITQEKDLCEEYMGKFPVISISLKSVDGADFQAASAALRRVIGNEACRFRFLSDSDRLSRDDRALYKGLTATTDGSFTMADDLLADSLRALSRLLSMHYGQQVILLIDEYDAPLGTAFRCGYHDEMANLLRSLLGNALKTNESLYFAVLTGCLCLPQESIFTDLNNLKVHTISDVRYDAFFGFTDAEVEEMLAFYGLSFYQKEIRNWYGGYRFGGTEVYCPWDVLNYCDELLADLFAPPQNYWAGSGENALILRMLREADQTTKDDVEELLSGKKIIRRIKRALSFREINESTENEWSALYAAGYLTGTHAGQADADLFQLWLPNRENYKLFYAAVGHWFCEVTRSDTERINRFCEAFPKWDVSTIQEMLRDYLWDAINVRDAALYGNRQETFYYEMLLGLLQSQERWLVRSSPEAEDDCGAIFVQTPDRAGIIIALKYAGDGDLKTACSEALKHITEKNYAEGLRRRGTKELVLYGIALCEKDCMVVIA